MINCIKCNTELPNEHKGAKLCDNCMPKSIISNNPSYLEQLAVAQEPIKFKRRTTTIFKYEDKEYCIELDESESMYLIYRLIFNENFSVYKKDLQLFDDACGYLTQVAVNAFDCFLNREQIIFNKDWINEPDFSDKDGQLYIEIIKKP
jgi:hypothetical protein